MPPRRPPQPGSSGAASVPPAAAKAAPARGARPAAKPVAKAAVKAVTKKAATRTAAAAPRLGSRTGPRKPRTRPAGSTRPRPGAAGRTGASGTALRAGAGRPVWVLGGVAVMLAVLILPYVQKWIVQRSEISASRADVADERREVTRLKEEQARWQDPDYVKAQARERLRFVLPGETSYVVVDGAPARTVPGDPGSQAAARVAASPEQPWFGDLWRSVQVAGETSAGP